MNDSEAGHYQSNMDRVYPVAVIAEAHRSMEHDRICGQIVICSMDHESAKTALNSPVKSENRIVMTASSSSLHPVQRLG